MVLFIVFIINIFTPFLCFFLNQLCYKLLDGKGIYHFWLKRFMLFRRFTLLLKPFILFTICFIKCKKTVNNIPLIVEYCFLIIYWYFYLSHLPLPISYLLVWFYTQENLCHKPLPTPIYNSASVSISPVHSLLQAIFSCASISMILLTHPCLVNHCIMATYFKGNERTVLACLCKGAAFLFCEIMTCFDKRFSARPKVFPQKN